MTTPERLRARQYREGVVLLLLALFTIGQAIYFKIQDGHQKDCIASKVTDISNVFQARAELTTQESEATQHVILASGKVHSTEEFQRILMEYSNTIDRINAERDAHPVPDFPPGDCSSDDETPAAALLAFVGSIAP